MVSAYNFVMQRENLWADWFASVPTGVPLEDGLPAFNGVEHHRNVVLPGSLAPRGRDLLHGRHWGIEPGGWDPNVPMLAGLVLDIKVHTPRVPDQGADEG